MQQSSKHWYSTGNNALRSLEDMNRQMNFLYRDAMSTVHLFMGQFGSMSAGASVSERRLHRDVRPR